MLWHYTPATHLAQIVCDGFIKVSMVDFPNPRHQAVWFSTNTRFETTAATLARRLDGCVDELPPTLFGYGRIGVDEADVPHSFDEYLNLSGLPTNMRDQLLERAAAVRANPAEWFAVFEPLRQEKWKKIEVLWNHNWIDVHLAGHHNLGQLIANCIEAWIEGREVAIVPPLNMTAR